jgi:hypothetical protein
MKLYLGKYKGDGMKMFVMFGAMRIGDEEVVVHNIVHTEYIEESEIESRALALGGADYLAPHYYDGKITFTKFTKERDYA